MKFTITGLISYEVEEEFFNNILKKANITLEDYKREISNNFKEMIKEEISVLDKVTRNLKIETDMQVN